EVRRDGVRMRDDAQIRKIDLRVLPVKLPGANDRCFLILFEDNAPGGPPPRASFPTTRAGRFPRQGVLDRLRDLLSRSSDTPQGQAAAADVAESAQLRQELASTREYLQSVIEQQDASNEELKSANEEILSANEELQSANEELETAKEELQSVNEELTTVNEQLQNRNLELSRLNDDVSNLLGSANVPMVAVGVDLRIRRFTPSAGKLLNLLPSDVGRPIGNLKPIMQVADLDDLIKDVIDMVQMKEREVQDAQGRWYSLRVYPYRTADNKIDGAVIVVLDINELKTQGALLREQASLIDLSSDAVIVCDANKAITFWNRGAQQMYGWSQAEAKGQKVHELLQTQFSGGSTPAKTALRETGHWEGELIHRRKDGTAIVVESRQVLLSEKGEVAPLLEI